MIALGNLLCSASRWRGSIRRADRAIPEASLPRSHRPRARKDGSSRLASNRRKRRHVGESVDQSNFALIPTFHWSPASLNGTRTRFFANSINSTRSFSESPPGIFRHEQGVASVGRKESRPEPLLTLIVFLGWIRRECTDRDGKKNQTECFQSHEHFYFVLCSSNFAITGPFPVQRLIIAALAIL